MNHNLKMKVNVETMKELMSWLKRSSLADEFPLLLKTDNVEKIINGFDMWEETQHRELFTGVCIMLIISRLNGKSSHLQSIMFHVLQLMNTIDPMNIHGHVEYLLNKLRQIHSIYIDLNNVLFHLAMALMSPWRHATPGMSIGVCLLWAIVDNVMKLNITMHRYREFDELANALGPQPCLDVNQLSQKEIGDLRLLLESIIQLLDAQLSKNVDLKRFGYPDHFFHMQYHDIESMESWCENLALQINGKPQDQIYIQDMSVNLLITLHHVKMKTSKPIEQQQQQAVEWPQSWLASMDTYSDVDD